MLFKPIAGRIRRFIPFPRVFVRRWMWLHDWSSNSLTMIPQFIALTITPWDLNSLVMVCLSSLLSITPPEVLTNAKYMVSYKWVWVYCFKCYLTHIIIIKSNCKARISLALSFHLSLSFIAPCRSSKLHLVSLQSWYKLVLAVRSTLARPYVGVHWRRSVMSSSWLLQQCPACLFGFNWMFF